MSTPLASLADVYVFQTTTLEKLVASIHGNDWLHRPGQTSHAYWLLGHVAYCRHAMLRLAGEADPVEEWEKLFGRGSKPDLTINGPAVATLLADLRQTGPRLVEKMKTLTDTDLARDTGRALPTGTTLLANLSFMSYHEAYHIGQIALLARSAAKLDPA
jgi:uncharacterized damage-inducible protein DinB